MFYICICVCDSPLLAFKLSWGPKNPVKIFAQKCNKYLHCAANKYVYTAIALISKASTNFNNKLKVKYVYRIKMLRK